MGWNCEFFVPKNNVFRKQWMNSQEESAEIGNQKNKFAHCSGCNQPIGIVSTMLYEIDEKRYCSQCYFQIITHNAP